MITGCKSMGSDIASVTISLKNLASLFTGLATTYVHYSTWKCLMVICLIVTSVFHVMHLLCYFYCDLILENQL